MTSTPAGVAILGSTGSIGSQTLDVIKAHPDQFRAVGLVAGSDADALARQAAEFDVAFTGLGGEAAVELAQRDDVDIIVNAIVGAAGLRASLATLRAGKRLALANKESLVAGGELCLAALAEGGGELTAIDSEHAALAQCLEGRAPDTVKRIVVTASGGPFRQRMDLSSVTVDEALAHPTWSMGRKITIDSATLMNKGLEVIEAHFLFGIDFDRIDVIVHPQSVVHGMVEFVDGSLIMQAGPADMRIPIQAALTSPRRVGPAFSSLDPMEVGRFDFEPVDRERFPALDLAYEAGRKGQTFPAVLNAANEVAVAAFLDSAVSFTDIASIVAMVVERHEPTDATELDAVLSADAWARDEAKELIARREVAQR